MRELYELKEKLIDELKEYGGKELSAGSLDVIDKLAHATKNLCKVLESADGDYSEDGGYSRYGSRMPYNRGASYRRDSRGRYASRYSNANDEMVDKLTELMETAPEEMRSDIQRLKSKVESMR